MTNSGYDILALHNLKSRGIIAGLGDKIGTGKESDVYLAITPRNTNVVLKFHRLGRTSFRDVKKKRDYFMVNAVSKNKKQGTQYRTLPNSWLFLSRTSALKEYSFMKALYDVGYQTPKPVGQNRHIVAMGLVRGVPLYQLHSNRVSAAQAQSIFEQSAVLAGSLAQHGLVHCDLNEFNLMVDLSGVQSKIANSGIDDNDDLTVDGEEGKKDWEDDATEHYARHSGAPVTNRGALSAHGPLQKHSMDGTGEVVTEKAPAPVELLDNGEPKPIVTLIDFPQMISTRHPNAQELYERDVLCLKKFFGKKLRCFVEGEDGLSSGIMPTWEELIVEASDGIDISDAGADDVTLPGCGADDVTLVSKAQLRLDEELFASGYSKEDAARGTELAYYEAHQQKINRDVDDVIDEEDSEDEDEEGGNNSVGPEEGEDGDKNNSHKEAVNAGKKQARKSPIGEDDDQAPELINMDELHIQSSGKGGKCNNDDASFAGGVSIGGMSRMSTISYAEAEQRARERVQRHLEDRKRAAGKKGAFKTRNSNKSYSKGKRVMNDFGL